MTTTPPRDNDRADLLQSPTGDSTYDSPHRPLSTFTITSDVVYNVEEYGRTYAVLEGNESLFPNDEREQDHQDLFHFMLHNVLEKRLFLAPALLDGGGVLDMGTGTGIWSLDMADEDGARTVLGVDMTPIQPRWVPPNTRFEIWDLEKEQDWTHQDPFRLIFGRQLGGCIKDWKNLELDWKHNTQNTSRGSEHQILQLYELASEAIGNLGRRLDVGEDFEGLLREQGFTNIVHHRILVPLGKWSEDPHLKRTGQIRQEEIETGLQAFVLKPFIKGLNWSLERVEAFLIGVRRDLRGEDVHLFSNLHVVFGQKQ